MKKWLLFLSMTFTFNLTSEQETKDLESPALQILFDHFVNDNSTVFLEHFTQEMIEKEKCLVHAEDLIQRFKELASDPRIAESFKRVIAKLFETQEDIEDAATFIQSDLYQKYNRSLNMVNVFCQAKALETFQLMIKELNKRNNAINEKTIVGPIVELTTANHQAVLKSNDYVVINVCADWSTTCKYMAPIFKEMNQKYGTLYCFVKLQADEQEALSKTYKIQGLPTILFIKKGVVVGQELGFMNKARFSAKLETYFQDSSKN